MAYDVEQLINFQNQIGDDPIMPTGRDKLDAMESFKDPETLEEVMAAMKLKEETDPKYSNKFKRQPPMPLYGGGQPDLGEQAQNVSDAGRMGDSMLMHVNPEEVKGLASIAPITVNPETGLPEAFAPAMLAALAASSAAVPAAVGTAATLGATAAGIGGSGGIGFLVPGASSGLSALGPQMLGYGALPSWMGGGGNFLSNLWGGYQALNPILKGAIKGTLMSPIQSMLTGQEYGAEDAFAGAVLGAVTGGVEMGIDELVPDVPTTAKTIASKDSTTELSKRVLSKPTSTSDKIWGGVKKAATDPLFLGLSGLALASAGPEEQRGRIEDVDVEEPFNPRPTPSSREFVGPITEEDIIAGVVEGEGEEDTGLGRQLQTAKEGGIVSLYVGGTPKPGSHEHLQRYGTFGGPAPGSVGYLQRYGTFGEQNPYETNPFANDPQRNPHLQNPIYGITSGSDDGGELPIVQEKEQVPVVPFTTNTSSFNVADRVKRIAGEPTPVPEIPVIATETPVDVSFGPKSTAALDDLFNRFEQKQGTDEIVDLVSSALPAQQGGLLSVRRPQIFEGQVPVLGDGMDDAIKFNVVPQTPADIPNTPDMALLSSDEYVVPADVVSMLGNGSSTAGAKALDQFNSLIRKKAHGTNKQQTELDAGKELSSLG